MFRLLRYELSLMTSVTEGRTGDQTETNNTNTARHKHLAETLKTAHDTVSADRS